MVAKSLSRPAPAPGLRGLWRRLLLAHQARRQRIKLSQLDDARLADIGLTRNQAEAEAARWDVPTNWRH
ncbi:DUF1127 domain-containing protein [Falsirhodobacter xinxiangensis]|uniref:DUF1127 domain-containing protein n=1 Tax=Falsirhodobacter xinxiangensis TaxID=2530049 RepID=UPI0010AB0886|nr:DUF1127 domain-containing protein [Rhodobacter xinxiangensis]